MKYDSVLDQQSISGKIVSLILCVWKPCYVKSGHITVVDKQKYLGVTFDSRLTWSLHISKVCGSKSYYLMLINCHVKYLPSTIVKMLIESLVFSRYTYALPVWAPVISRDSMSWLHCM